jgi:hypothetical protein
MFTDIFRLMFSCASLIPSCCADTKKVEELGMLGQQGGAPKPSDSAGGGTRSNTDWKQRSGDILKTVKDLEQKVTKMF